MTSAQDGFRKSQQLPVDLADYLRRLHSERSPEFVVVLRAALDAGWTQSAIGRAVGLTRQAMSYQAKRTDRSSVRVAARRINVPRPPRRQEHPSAPSPKKAVSQVTEEEAAELRALYEAARAVRGPTPDDSPGRRASERLAYRLDALHRRGVPMTHLSRVLGVAQNNVKQRLVRYGYQEPSPSALPKLYKGDISGRGASAKPAAEDPPQAGRWTCPGRHCGDYQGYKYGCRKLECTAAVAPYSAARRAAAGTEPRTAIDQAIRQQLLDAVRHGISLARACAAAGITPFRLGGARRADPAFDAELIAAASEGGLNPPLRPVRQLRCPGDDCGTLEGYRHGCRKDACRQEHSAALRRAPSRQRDTTARRFGPEDAEAVLEHLCAGHTVVDAARLAGWSYDALSNARKNDPDLDAAVIAAREEGRQPGSSGDHARAVSRVDRD